MGFFGGKYDPVQSPFANYAAALGCTNALEFHSLTSEQLAERHGKAWERLLRRRKLEPMLRKLAKSGIPVPADAIQRVLRPVAVGMPPP